MPTSLKVIMTRSYVRLTILKIVRSDRARFPSASSLWISGKVPPPPWMLDAAPAIGSLQTAVGCQMRDGNVFG